MKGADTIEFHVLSKTPKETPTPRMASSEPRHEKTCLRVSDQVRLKPTCAATEAS